MAEDKGKGRRSGGSGRGRPGGGSGKGRSSGSGRNQRGRSSGGRSQARGQGGRTGRRSGGTGRHSRGDGTRRGGAGHARSDGRRRTGSDRRSEQKGDARSEGGRFDMSRVQDVDLPGFVKNDLARVTPKDRVEPALRALAEAMDAFERGDFKKAIGRARRAKDLAPRDATVREMLGLAAYRLQEWETALQELRTYRRFSGETTHLPIEMDLARALGKKAEVTARWKELRRLGASPPVMKEGRVVYASFLLDEDRPREAWEIVHPKKLSPRPEESDLRLWYVAARAAARLGDKETAQQLYAAIVGSDPGFPGLDELEIEIR